MNSATGQWKAPRFAGRLVATGFAAGALLLGGGCQEKEQTSPPPAPQAENRPCEAAARVVDGLPGRVGDWCVDERMDVRRYGSGSASPLDSACDELFRGDCPSVRSYGLEQVKTLRYVDGSGAPHFVNVTLTRFRESAGAFGFFTARVLGEEPPSRVLMEPLEVAGRAALGGGKAKLWRGKQVAELTYVSEDETPTEVERESGGALVHLARALSESLPGPREPRLDVRLLETMQPLPLAVAHRVDGALGVVGSGDFSLAHFAGATPHRLMVALRRDPDGAEDFSRLLRRQLRGHKFKHQPILELRVASERHPSEVWFATQLGRLVLLVGPPLDARPQAKTKAERDAEKAGWRSFAVQRVLAFRKKAAATLAAR